MQDPQRYRGPDGSVYEALPDGTYRRTPPQAQQAPAAQAGPGFRLQPMVTPAEQRAREEREYDRQRDAERDARLDRNEGRQIDTQERLARTEERAVATAELAQRGGTPELRGRLALGLGPSVRAVDSMAAQHQGVNPLNRDWGATLIDSIPDFGLLSAGARVIGGQDYQDYNQSLKTVESSLLPIFSGMAVTPTEAQRFMKANQPQLGDSPETIQRKTQNVQIILNEGAHLAGRPIPYPEAGRYGEEGFRQLLASGDAASVTAPRIGEAGGAGNGPQPGDVRVTQQPLAPTDSPNSLSAQGYVYDAGRDIWTRSSQVEVNPEAINREAGADRTAQGEGAFRKVDAGMRGAADTLTFGLSDEIVAGLNTVLPLDRGSQSLWTEGAGDAYVHNLAMQRGIDQADARDVPVSRAVGQVAGGVGGGIAATAPRIAGAVSRPLLAQVGRGVATGTAYGGAYGFGSGEGNAVERLPSAGQGAAIGGVAGGVAPVAVNVAGRVLSPAANALADGARFAGRQVVNALGDNAPEALRTATAPNALARGLERFAGTNRPNINALNATREQLEGAVGRPVATASVINTGGRAMLRGVATRSDGAREIAENFGQGTAEALPARVGQQGRRVLSNDTRSPDDIRAALDAERSNMARTTYAEPYAQPVEIGEDIAGALSGAPGRAAIQRARSAAEAWQDTAVMAELDALEAAARAGQPLPQVSAGAVDRIRQAMSGRGEKLAQNPATRAVGAGVQNRAGQVDGALENVEGLAPARAAYRDASRQIEAVDAGERFMGSAPDQVAADMRGAPASAQAPFRAGAARSIERAAGSTQTAPGVANRLAIPGTPQRQMMDETLGPDDARRLSDAMRGERDIYRGAQQVDPGVGSQTTNNAMKAGEAAGLVGDVVGGRPLGAVRRVIGLLDSRGFNPQQAEAVLEAMTDPNRTDEVISILSQRMNRREARNLTRALRYQLTIGPQSGQQN